MIKDMLKLNLIQIKGYSLPERDKSKTEILSSLDEALKNSPDIVLFPECSFPSYSLHEWSEDVNQECLSLLEELKEKVKGNECYIVIGLPEEVSDEKNIKKLYNSAYVINPQGEIETIARKQFLWHFDSKWFSSGKRSAFFDTKWGRIGLMICADGRAPEISKSLGLLKCDLVLNSTNWVTSGADEKKLSNPQADFLMQVRALEQNYWIAAANKVGMEDDFIVFCGKSMLVNPQGQIECVASSYKAEIVECMIPLDTETGKISRNSKDIEPFTNDIGFRTISVDSGELKKKEYIYSAVASSHISGKVEEKIEEVLKKSDLLGAELLVASINMEEDLGNIREKLNKIDGLKGKKIINLRNDKEALTLISVEGNNVFVEENSIVEFGCQKMGVVFDEFSLSADISRSMMVSDVNILLWIHGGRNENYRIISRARAMESRIFVISLCGGEQFSSMICGPDGNIITESFAGKDQIVTAYLDLNLCERKLVVPGTDIKESAAKYRRI